VRTTGVCSMLLYLSGLPDRADRIKGCREACF
jgi:hypothetical protein